MTTETRPEPQPAALISDDAIRAAAAARRCIWDPRQEEHPDCKECLNAARIALEAAAPLLFESFLAALPVEWAVQYTSIPDQEFGRLIGRINDRPMTADEAGYEVRQMTAGRIPARAVSRHVTQWTPTTPPRP